jgi:hypothetical protein
VTALIRHLAPDGSPVIDLADPITAAACATHEGEILNPVVRAALGGGA